MPSLVDEYGSQVAPDPMSLVDTYGRNPPPPKPDKEAIANAMQWRKSVLYGRVPPTPAEAEADRAARYAEARGMTPQEMRQYGNEAIVTPGVYERTMGMVGPSAMGMTKPVTGLMQQVLESRSAPGIPVTSSGAILPREAGMYTPIEQAAIPRVTPTGKVAALNERSQALIESKAAGRAADRLIEAGRPLNIQQWYGTEPLRQFALNEGLTLGAYYATEK